MEKETPQQSITQPENQRSGTPSLNTEVNQLRSFLESLGYSETQRSASEKAGIEEIRQRWRYLQNLLLAGTHDPG